MIDLHKFKYAGSSQTWPSDDLESLRDMLNCAERIGRNSFVINTESLDRQELEAKLGYATHFRKGLVMDNDLKITYHRSVVRGERCYFFLRGDIAYIFTAENVKQAA